MDRRFYLNLASRGLRMPVGTHLVLHRHRDADAILLDGERLGGVMVETARQFRTPLAIPVMDLTVEKAVLAAALGVAPEHAATWHAHGCPDAAAADRLDRALADVGDARWRANTAAIRRVAREPDLVASGMCIGPFSLMTKVLPEPITAVYLAGSGITAEEDDEVRALEAVLELCVRTVAASIRAQAAAGAKLMFVCEPAANTVYLSPLQVEQGGSDVWERLVMQPNLRLRSLLADLGVDLLFHDCGELTPKRIADFARLDPAILSLGSPVRLWEAAPHVPAQTVLYGNLPSKKFFSDSEVTEEQVRTQARELLEKMRAAGHPFILGSECDVLSVPGCEATIERKVQAFMTA